MTWYAVRSFVDHGGSLYEERVVLFEAESEERAFSLAEEDARLYEEQLTDVKSLPMYQCYRVGDEPIASGTEVFSLMRTDKRTPEKYVARYFDTGRELQRHEDE